MSEKPPSELPTSDLLDSGSSDSDSSEGDLLKSDLLGNDLLDTEPEAAPPEKPKAGTVALVGRPNAGKSTLMNYWLKEKLAIVSNKPQTTRHRIVGILSEPRGQIVFFDTPGVHKPQHQMNRRMLKAAKDALLDADVVCLLHDVSQPFGRGDQFLLDWVQQIPARRIALLNKVDLVQKPKVLPRIQTYAESGAFEEIVPVSAAKGDGADLVLDLLWPRLPEGPPLHDPELLTVHPERFLVAERIREKVLKTTRDELPFSTAVVIESWEQRTDGLLEIHASILAERQGQKKILIGAGGQQIKAIGTAARKDLESYLGQRVFLDLRVKVEADWRENQRILADLDREPLAGDFSG